MQFSVPLMHLTKPLQQLLSISPSSVAADDITQNILISVHKNSLVLKASDYSIECSCVLDLDENDVKAEGCTTVNAAKLYGSCKNPQSNRTISIGDTLVKALKEYKKEQEEYKKFYGDSYLKHYEKKVINEYTKREEIKIVDAKAELELNLKEAQLIFVKPNGQFRGTETVRHAFKVINYELGIPCRFHDFRDTHATRLIENGADIKAVSKRLGHSTIQTTYNIYVRITEKMETDTVDRFENYTNSLDIPAITKLEYLD